MDHQRCPPSNPWILWVYHIQEELCSCNWGLWTFKIGRLFWIIQWAQSNHNESLKLESFLWLKSERFSRKESQRGSECERDWPCWRGLWGKHGKECRQPLEASLALDGLLARPWGPQSYHHKELNLAHNLNDLCSRFFPEAPRENLVLPAPQFQPPETLSRGPTWAVLTPRSVTNRFVF